MTSLRIGQVTHRFSPSIGGVESHVAELSTRLVGRGHEVTVFTGDMIGDFPKSEYRVEVQDRSEAGIRIKRFRSMSLLGSAFSNRTIMPSMIPSLIKERLDIIHAHSLGYYPTFASALPKLVKRSKLIITAHSDPTFGSYKPRLASLPLRLADRVIALTRREREWFLRNGFASDKVMVIPNGIDLERFHPVQSGDAFKEKYGIQDQMVLFVGRIDIDTKGCDILVKAIPRVLEDHPKARFVFVGPDWGARDDLQAVSSSLNVDPIFTGAVSQHELLEAYTAADLVVVPSRVEAFCIVLLEAMACGKPIVASRVGGVPDVVNNSNAILTQPGGTLELAAAISKLLSDKTLAGRLGEAGRRRVTRYSWDRIVEEIEHVYFSALEHRQCDS
jgi:glycosyltransferase involved in cell wall biosynthesis